MITLRPEYVADADAKMFCLLQEKMSKFERGFQENVLLFYERTEESFHFIFVLLDKDKPTSVITGRLTRE